MEKKYFLINDSEADQAVEEAVYEVRGNVVAIPEVPQPQVTTPEPERKPRTARTVRRNRRNIAWLTPAYLLYLGVVTVVLCFSVMSLLTVTSEITSAEKKLAAVTSELNSIKSDNSAAEVYLDRSIDLEKVYQIAVNEYGMVYPKSDQIVYYRQNRGSYVIQNEQIPTD